MKVGYAADRRTAWKLDMKQTEGLELGYAADRRTGSWICSRQKGWKLDMKQTGGLEVGYEADWKLDREAGNWIRSSADRRVGIQSLIILQSFVATAECTSPLTLY